MVLSLLLAGDVVDDDDGQGHGNGDAVWGNPMEWFVVHLFGSSTVLMGRDNKGEPISET